MNTSELATTPILGFPDMVGNCIGKHLFARHSISSTVVEFFVLMVMVASGLMSNYSLWKTLMEEKKNKPIGRKGNVIEPILGWYCIMQSVFWPYFMLVMWIFPIQVATWEGTPSWFVYIELLSLFLGRTYIAFNSLCCATIRYWFIVHQEKANQWNYEKTGRNFQLGSVLLPLTLITVFAFVVKFAFVTTGTSLTTSFDNNKFEACMVLYDNLYLGANSTQKLPRAPFLYLLTTNFVPLPIVDIIHFIAISALILVYSNGIEAYLYFKIFKNIKG